jgi:hypothetical protein
MIADISIREELLIIHRIRNFSYRLYIVDYTIFQAKIGTHDIFMNMFLTSKGLVLRGGFCSAILIPLMQVIR